MGAWGACKRGWAEVKDRYDWAAPRFVASGATLQIEYLASGVSGDLAYTVAIERSASHVIGQSAPAQMPLRVTQLFRKEDGDWKLIHRQADPLVEETAPGKRVLKKAIDVVSSEMRYRQEVFSRRGL